MLSSVTGKPVRSCSVPEMMIVSPACRPCNTLCLGFRAYAGLYFYRMCLSRFVEEYLVFTHFRYDGFRGDGKCVRDFVFAQADVRIAARHDCAIGVRIEGTQGQCMGTRVHTGLAGIYFGMECLEFAFQSEVDPCTDFHVVA